ncbi:hypothetical protein ACLOJK_013161 [Asimina triloba]
MATPQSLKLLEVCRVSPPPGSVPQTFLPLTIYDVYWIAVPPIQRLLFYELNTTTAHFIEALLPQIKYSLALTLRFFFSLAGNLHLSHSDGNHEIRYVDGDSVSLTVAESDGVFQRLAKKNDPIGATECRPFLPRLTPPSLFALQFTVFPNAGIALGISIQHAVCDGRSLAHFMKSWSSICRNGNDDTSIIQPPFYDRTSLAEKDSIKRGILKQMEDAALKHKKAYGSDGLIPNMPIPALRATFVLSRANIESLRRLALDLVEESEKPFHCSTFVLTCSYVWICLIKSRGEDAGDRIEHFAFAADARARLKPPLPAQYFGNCLSGCHAAAKRSDLVSERGMLAATKVIQKSIKRLEDRDPGKSLENSISGSMELMEQRLVSVAGSPQFRVYDIDFGWGRPKKTEVASIDITGAIYVGDSRDEEGGIEVGLSLPELEMHSFASLFQEGLEKISQCDQGL